MTGYKEKVHRNTAFAFPHKVNYTVMNDMNIHLKYTETNLKKQI